MIQASSFGDYSGFQRGLVEQAKRQAREQGRAISGRVRQLHDDAKAEAVRQARAYHRMAVEERSAIDSQALAAVRSQAARFHGNRFGLIGPDLALAVASSGLTMGRFVSGSRIVNRPATHSATANHVVTVSANPVH